MVTSRVIPCSRSILLAYQIYLSMTEQNLYTELESALQIGDTHSIDDDNGWKEDWGGNLLLYDKEVVANNANSVEVKFCDWVLSNAADANGLRGLELLFRFIYNMKDIPVAAQKILAYALRRPAESADERFGHTLMQSNEHLMTPLSSIKMDGQSKRQIHPMKAKLTILAAESCGNGMRP